MRETFTYYFPQSSEEGRFTVLEVDVASNSYVIAVRIVSYAEGFRHENLLDHTSLWSKHTQGLHKAIELHTAYIRTKALEALTEAIEADVDVSTEDVEVFQ